MAQYRTSARGQLKTLEQRPRRVVSNLRGGQVYRVEARRTVRFAPSKALIRRVNGVHIIVSDEMKRSGSRRGWQVTNQAGRPPLGDRD